MLRHKISIFACFLIRVDSRQYFKSKIFICICAFSFKTTHAAFQLRFVKEKVKEGYFFYLHFRAQAVPVKKKEVSLKADGAYSTFPE